VIVAYCVVNFILQSLIQPKFVGDAVGLSTSITFLSLVIWAFLPVLIDVDPRNAWLVPLLSNQVADPEPDEPATAPEAALALTNRATLSRRSSPRPRLSRPSS
jgi:AI-2 transport protein TqsA